MKKLFISQPMMGLSDEQIKAERERIIKTATTEFGEVEVIDSFFEGVPADVTPLWYLGHSIALLAKADVAYFAKGWDAARGCKIEHECAVQYGIETIEE